MIALNPKPRALLASSKSGHLAGGKTDPIVPRESLSFVDDTAFKHECFGPTVTNQFGLDAHIPDFKRDVLIISFRQACVLDAGSTLVGTDIKRVEINRVLFLVIGVELPQLHEDRAARFRARNMVCTNRIADICARRIVAMLVLKNAFQDDEFLTTTMGVLRKGTALCVADDARRARDFVTDAVEHTAVHTRHR